LVEAAGIEPASKVDGQSVTTSVSPDFFSAAASPGGGPSARQARLVFVALASGGGSSRRIGTGALIRI